MHGIYHLSDMFCILKSKRDWEAIPQTSKTVASDGTPPNQSSLLRHTRNLNGGTFEEIYLYFKIFIYFLFYFFFKLVFKKLDSLNYKFLNFNILIFIKKIILILIFKIIFF